MPDERLRAVISAKGETIQSMARHVGVDLENVERWITTNRTPHRGHRRKATSFLGVDEVCPWPVVEKQAETASTSELITCYPPRGAVPTALWSSCIEKATDRMGILVYAGLFLFDSHPDLPYESAEKAKAGARVRVSIHRFDEDVLVNPHVLGASAGQNPVPHFRYIPGARMFRHHMRSFDRTWERGTPIVL